MLVSKALFEFEAIQDKMIIRKLIEHITNRNQLFEQEDIRLSVRWSSLIESLFLRCSHLLCKAQFYGS